LCGHRLRLALLDTSAAAAHSWLGAVTRDDAFLLFPIPDPPRLGPVRLARSAPAAVRGHGAEDPRGGRGEGRRGSPKTRPVELVVLLTSDCAGAVQAVSYASSNAHVLQGAHHAEGLQYPDDDHDDDDDIEDLLDLPVHRVSYAHSPTHNVVGVLHAA